METLNTEVRLLGQKIPLKSSGDPKLVSEVLGLVAKRIEAAEARPGAPKTPHHVLLLALLELAEEYIQAKRRMKDYQGNVETKSKELFKMIEAQLK
ncbi:cell division protein ZapA [bacterium]|jgi:hypothetical protein|nr:cell division protein ZapA [bacterium]